MAIVVVGDLVGLAMAALLARLIRVFLVGISPTDPTTLVGIPLLLGGVAPMAALIQARRAGRVGPVAAPRTE
jgi:uncharacterized membrane protein HdeD (DUF308 family)